MGKALLVAAGSRCLRLLPRGRSCRPPTTRAPTSPRVSRTPAPPSWAWTIWPTGRSRRASSTRPIRAPSGSSRPTWRSRATTRSSAASTASRSSTSPTRRTRRSRRPSSAPAARATCPSTGTCCSCRSRRAAPGSTAGPTRRSARASRACGSSTSATSPSPVQVAAVQTCRGSHTHTLVDDVSDPDHVYIYVSGDHGRPARDDAGRLQQQPGERRDPSRWRIEVIKVPVAAPENAAVVSEPRLFTDPATGAIDGLQNQPPTPLHPSGIPWGPTPITDACHDITVYQEFELAAGACEGNGLLIDISDPANPRRIDAVADPLCAYWHGATFTNDGTVSHVHRRVGRRHRSTLPCDRPAPLGRRRDLRDRRRPARSSAATTSSPWRRRSENCVSHIPRSSRSRDGTLRPGLVPGRRVAGRLRRRVAPLRDRLLRPRADQRRRVWCSAASGRPTGTTARPTARRSLAASTRSG